jgi:CRISPR-associated protein Cmr4
MSTTTKKYQTLVFRLQALTNLHAGSGDSFYGAVDKLVQRDPATRRPTIHSHSLKGALREYFESQIDFEQGAEAKKKFITHVFGSAVSGDENASEQGNYRFFSADILAIPVPDENINSSTAFKLTSSDDVWAAFVKKTKMLGGNEWTADSLRAAFQSGATFHIDAEKFAEASEELPVVARNQLDNGESQNLWYEELVPHQSLFGFLVQAPLDMTNGEKLNAKQDFIQNLNNKVIQIGANATVGYGYCLLTLLNPPTKS